MSWYDQAMEDFSPGLALGWEEKLIPLGTQ